MKIHPVKFVLLVLTTGLWWAVIFWVLLNMIYIPEVYIQFNHLLLPCFIVSLFETNYVFIPDFSRGDDYEP